MSLVGWLNRRVVPWITALGITPRSVTLEVRGRRSGRPVRVALSPATLAGNRAAVLYFGVERPRLRDLEKLASLEHRLRSGQSSDPVTPPALSLVPVVATAIRDTELRRRRPGQGGCRPRAMTVDRWRRHARGPGGGRVDASGPADHALERPGFARCSLRPLEWTRAEEIPMGRPHATENDGERARPKAFVAGLSEATITHPIGNGRTVGVGLAHLAFWDRPCLAKFAERERTG